MYDYCPWRSARLQCHQPIRVLSMRDLCATLRRSPRRWLAESPHGHPRHLSKIATCASIMACRPTL
jgi:hypothetical protein